MKKAKKDKENDFVASSFLAFFLVLLPCCDWQFFLVSFVFWLSPSSSINLQYAAFGLRAGGLPNSSFGSPTTQVGGYHWFSNPPSLRLL